MQLRPRTVLAPLAGLAVLGLLVATGSPAGAHVEPDVESVPAGSTSTVQFTVEHGCDGSPTVKMEFQVPDTVTDAAAVDKPGWKGAVVEGVVTYTGGSLPDAEEGRFGIRFTAPTTLGAVVTFPLIQTCEQGSLDWIEADEEDEHPAPSVVVGDPDPSATTAPTGASTPTTDRLDTSGTTDLAAATTTTAPAERPADPSGGDAGSSTTSIVLLVAGAAVVVGGAVWYLRRDRTGEA